MKIIVAEKISASAVAQLQEPGWTILTADQLDGKLAEHLETADALIVRSAVQADSALLAHAKKLRVIGRAGVGVDIAGRKLSFSPEHISSNLLKLLNSGQLPC